MGAARLRGYVKYWNQKYIRLFSTTFRESQHLSSFPKLSAGFYGRCKAFGTCRHPRISPFESSRGILLGLALALSDASHEFLPAKSRDTLSHFSSSSKHSSRGVGNKTLQDFGGEIKTKTVRGECGDTPYQAFTSASLYRPRHLLLTTRSNTCLFGFGLLSRWTGKLAETISASLPGTGFEGIRCRLLHGRKSGLILHTRKVRVRVLD